MGTIETTGAFVRVSARTRAWERAEKKARLMDANAADPSPAARVSVEDALDAFIARKQGQRLSHSWFYKFSLMQRELVSFAHGRGLTYIDEFSDDDQREIDHTEYDVCAECWNSLLSRRRIKDKGRPKRHHEIVTLPTLPVPESPHERHEPQQPPFPGAPPKIYVRADPVN